MTYFDDRCNIQETFRLGGFSAESLESLDYYTEAQTNQNIKKR